jgi:alpha-tubulin suppressor-like RCC1 family protein
LISQAYIPFVNTFRDKIFGPISSLVVMGENVLILAGNGTIYGYGNNAYGELGTGDSTTYNSNPTIAAGGLKAKKIAAGEYTAFALG